MIKDLMKNFKVTKYVLMFCPLYAVWSVLYIISNAAIAVLRVWLIAELGDLVISLINSGNGLESFNEVVYIIVVYIIVNGIATVYRRLYMTYIRMYYMQIYFAKILNKIFGKVQSIDFADFDNPEFYDIYSRAIRESRRGYLAFNNIVSFISSIVNIITLGAFIIINDIWLIVIVLVSTIIRVIIAAKKNKNQWEFDKNSETDRRMYNYVNRTFYQQRFAAEIKTTPISDLLIEKCYDAQDSIDKLFKETIKKNSVLSVINSAVSHVFEMGAVYFYLGIKVIKNVISIGSFSSVLDAANQFSNKFVDMARFINELKNNALYINYFIDFMEYKPTLEEQGKLDLNENFEVLNINDVTFSYPKTEKNALENVNLTIKRGKKIAIVGLNGAGKTTLIKMLLKFYNPDNGDIYYNNQTIRDSKEKDVRNKFSIIFQDYRLYAVTIAENVLMRRVKTEEDERRVWEALEKVDMIDVVNKYPKGINTLQSRELDEKGASFSGGEQQRIALARVFASDADVYILDEPTSNLDPLAERNINKLIIEKSQEKTIIIIAHRLSTVVDADEIILIENGKIVEKGSHDYLMKTNGKYANMFNTQAALYKRN